MALPSIFDLSPEQRAQMDKEWAEKVAAGQTAPRRCLTSAAAAPTAPTLGTSSTLDEEAVAWYEANPWATQQPTRFNRTHFRPSVLRRR